MFIWTNMSFLFVLNTVSISIITQFMIIKYCMMILIIVYWSTVEWLVYSLCGSNTIWSSRRQIFETWPVFTSINRRCSPTTSYQRISDERNENIRSTTEQVNNSFVRHYFQTTLLMVNTALTVFNKTKHIADNNKLRCQNYSTIIT